MTDDKPSKEFLKMKEKIQKKYGMLLFSGIVEGVISHNDLCDNSKILISDIFKKENYNE